MVISWNDDLGNPQEPKECRVKDVGMMIVLQKDIENATRIGGNLKVELVDVTGVQDPVKMYRIFRFIPA
jgi:hypothetical protein